MFWPGIGINSSPGCCLHYSKVKDANDGSGCDGQVLVTHDLLGLYDRFTPKFVKQYAALHEEIDTAIRSYQNDVLQGKFPAQEHSFSISDQEWELFLSRRGEA